MELLLDILVDGALELLGKMGKITRRCKTIGTQILVDILAAAVALLAAGGSVVCYRQGNALASVGVALGLIALLIAVISLCYHIVKKRK